MHKRLLPEPLSTISWLRHEPWLMGLKKVRIPELGRYRNMKLVHFSASGRLSLLSIATHPNTNIHLHALWRVKTPTYFRVFVMPRWPNSSQIHTAALYATWLRHRATSFAKSVFPLCVFLSQQFVVDLFFPRIDLWNLRLSLSFSPLEAEAKCRYNTISFPYYWICTWC